MYMYMYTHVYFLISRTLAVDHVLPINLAQICVKEKKKETIIYLYFLSQNIIKSHFFIQYILEKL